MSADPAVASGWSNAFVHEIKVQRGVTRAVRPLAVRLEAGGTFLTSLLRGIRPLKGERGHIWLVCSKVLEDGGLCMWSVWHFELLISECFITCCERQQCYFSGKVSSAPCLLWNVKELVGLCFLCGFKFIWTKQLFHILLSKLASKCHVCNAKESTLVMKLAVSCQSLSLFLWALKSGYI